MLELVHHDFLNIVILLFCNEEMDLLEGIVILFHYKNDFENIRKREGAELSDDIASFLNGQRRLRDE